MRLSTSSGALSLDSSIMAATRHEVKGTEARPQNTPAPIRASLHMDIDADGLSYMGPPTVAKSTWESLRRDLTQDEFRKPEITVTIEITIFPDRVILMRGPRAISRATWKAIQHDLMNG
jgi:hypothetical protein